MDTQQTPAGQHQWLNHPATGWTYCGLCGVVRRTDGASKPCKAQKGTR